MVLPCLALLPRRISHVCFLVLSSDIILCNHAPFSGSVYGVIQVFSSPIVVKISNSVSSATVLCMHLIHSLMHISANQSHIIQLYQSSLTVSLHKLFVSCDATNNVCHFLANNLL